MNSLGRKVLVAALSVAVLLASAYALVADELRQWNDAAASLIRDSRRALLDGQLLEALTRATGETASYVLTGDERFRREAAEALGRADAAIAELRQIVAATPAPADASSEPDHLRRKEQLLLATRERLEASHPVTASTPAAQIAQALERLYAGEADADALAQLLADHHRSEQAANEQAMRDHGRHAQLVSLGVAGAIAAWMALLIAYVRRRVVEPLAVLARLTSSVAAGDVPRKVDVTHRDEIGQLQRSYNDMVEELAEQRAQLAALVDRLSRARDAAEAADRAKSDFLANVSHEVRTPMNGVMATLDLLHETADSDPHRELVEVARGSARRLLGLLNDLLDFSRIEAGTVALDARDFDPRRLVTQLVEHHAGRAAAKGLALTCTVAESTPALLHGDPTRLAQILSNLLDNAIKFTERGSIHVSVTPESPPARAAQAGDAAPAPPAWLRVRVTDSGIGVEPRAAPQLFQPFTQADGSTTRKYGGVGLGLSIARQLAQMMGGEIGFESERGKGSSFWFTVPARALVAPGTAASPVPAQVTPLAPGRRLLLVEDNRDNRDVMSRILRRRGLHVTGAENGHEALSRAAAEDFDLILMDCQMPEMDGFEATRRIRALPGARARAPIVALTAFGLTEQKQHYLDAGFDDLLPKPYTIEQMEDVLRRWLPPARASEVAPQGPGDTVAPGA